MASNSYSKYDYYFEHHSHDKNCAESLNRGIIFSSEKHLHLFSVIFEEVEKEYFAI